MRLTRGLAVLVFLGGCTGPVERPGAPPGRPVPQDGPATTDGAIAAGNLEGQITALQRRLSIQPRDRDARLLLLDLYLARARFLGRMSDLARAQRLVAELLEGWPDDGEAWLASARLAGRLHRFDLARAHLVRAGEGGVDGDAIDALRASLAEATGDLEGALELRLALASRQPSVATLGSLGALHVERGEYDAAATAFSEARASFRDVTPFPLAWLDVQRAALFLAREDVPAARRCYQQALARLPRFVRAAVLLAELEETAGELDRAVSVLLPHAESAEDPEVTGHLARLFAALGEEDRSKAMGRRAASMFGDLIAAHPEAFADHAAEFWLARGEPARALELAELNHLVKGTAASRALLETAALAATGEGGDRRLADREPARRPAP